MLDHNNNDDMLAVSYFLLRRKYKVYTKRDGISAVIFVAAGTTLFINVDIECPWFQVY